MDYPKLISEKWNLTAKFNCLQAIYFDAPSALAVPMCVKYTLMGVSGPSMDHLLVSVPIGTLCIYLCVKNTLSIKTLLQCNCSFSIFALDKPN